MLTDDIGGVLFDLDDTLFPQHQWLAGAWVDVARAAAAAGAVNEAAMLSALEHFAAEGSGRGRIIDRALIALGAGDVPVGSLVTIFRAHDPGSLKAYDGVAEHLRKLRTFVPVGLVSDGDVDLQQRKLRAIGLEDSFDVVVWSDELGRELRKPNPAPFLRALDLLALPAAAVVFVGDRPDKDIVGAQGVGMRSIRVRVGEYSLDEDTLAPWRTVATTAEAIELLLRIVAA